MLYLSGSDIFTLMRQINEDLEYIRKWLGMNKLSLNVNKTEYIVIGTKQRLNKIKEVNFDVNISGIPLKRVHTCKHLGVIIDENLPWREHIWNLQKIANSGLYVLKCIKDFSSPALSVST